MKQNKTEKANLENKRGYFFEIGLTLAILAFIAIFWWPTKVSKAEGFVDTSSCEEGIDDIIITRTPEKPELPPPPKQTISDIIEVVEQNVENEIPIVEEDPERIEFNTEAPVEIDMPVEEDPEPEIFFVVEDMPEFPGGELALRKYIAENVRYPEMAKENDIQGTVYVRFVVDEQGKVTNVEILRGVDPLLDKEAIRVVSSLPKWKPGKQRGRAVKVSHSVPIKFALQN